MNSVSLSKRNKWTHDNKVAPDIDDTDTDEFRMTPLLIPSLVCADFAFDRICEHVIFPSVKNTKIVSVTVKCLLRCTIDKFLPDTEYDILHVSGCNSSTWHLCDSADSNLLGLRMLIIGIRDQNLRTGDALYMIPCKQTIDERSYCDEVTALKVIIALRTYRTWNELCADFDHIRKNVPGVCRVKTVGFDGRPMLRRGQVDRTPRRENSKSVREQSASTPRRNDARWLDDIDFM